jgi:hypothetical protein
VYLNLGLLFHFETHGSAISTWPSCAGGQHHPLVFFGQAEGSGGLVGALVGDGGTIGAGYIKIDHIFRCGDIVYSQPVFCSSIDPRPYVGRPGGMGIGCR